MRKIQAQQTGPRGFTQQEVQSVVVPVPTGGWNAIDPIALMEPKYAAIMQNWIPQTSYVQVRPGYNAWVQAISNTAVESLMVYRPTGNEQMFAATDNAIYDVSTEGTYTQVQSDLSNSRWQHINYTPVEGDNYLYMVNGEDDPLYYNGTDWVNPTITDGPSPSDFINIASWARRIWFVRNNSTEAWYLPVDSIQGSLQTDGNDNVVDIGAYITKGGYLQAIGTLTIDGGYGPQNLICFISSRGEVVVYQGTDPTNASAFGLVGTFYIAPPLGRRCLMGYGADLAMITLQGVIPLSQAFPLDSDAIRGVALTNKIQNAMLNSAAMFQDNFGWEMSHFPAEGMFILNVPYSTNSQQVQYVMNALTGAWTQFTGWNSNCFALFNDQLYFGDNDGNVNLAWSGGADLVTPINADMQCAFNYFGNPGQLKQMTMVQPLLISSGPPTPTISVDTDFGNVSPTASVTTITQSGSEYDFSYYDQAYYSGGLQTQALWQGTQAVGHSLAIRIKVNLLPSGAGGQSVFDTGVFDTMVFDGFGTSDTVLQINAFNALVKFGGAV